MNVCYDESDYSQRGACMRSIMKRGLSTAAKSALGKR